MERERAISRRTNRNAKEGIQECTLAENLPLARLCAALGRQLVAELVKELLHFLAPFALGELVANAELGATRVGRLALGRGEQAAPCALALALR
jgi:hypothetical protein